LGAGPIIISVLVSDFDFHLPPELIAQHPPAERGAARMLHLKGGCLRDTVFSEFPALLRETDLVVFNDTRVLPARLFGHRSGHRAQRLSPHNPASREFLHGRVEVLLTRRLPGGGANDEQLWRALVRPGKKIMPGERLYFGVEAGYAPADGAPAAGAGGYAATDAAPAAGALPLLEAEVLERGEFGERTLRFLRGWSGWDTFLCRPTSTAPTRPRTGSATRRFSPVRRVRWRPRRRGCTLPGRFWSGCARKAWRRLR
jgi:S-adenosylmethionine:tRNA ribosyltransferase-isomerase